MDWFLTIISGGYAAWQGWRQLSLVITGHREDTEEWRGPKKEVGRVERLLTGWASALRPVQAEP